MLVEHNKFGYALIALMSGIIAIAMYSVGMVGSELKLISISTMILFLSVFCTQLAKRERNLLLILFLITFFIFLQSRVFVRLVVDHEEYEYFRFSTMKSIYSQIFFSLMGLQVGSFLRIKSYESKAEFVESRYNVHALTFTAKIFTVVAWICQLLTVMEKVTFYTVGFGGLLHTEFSSRLPSIVVSVSYLYIFSFCIFLATKPSKKECMPLFLMYIVLAATKLFYGSRGDFILGLMFAFVYFCIRDRIRAEDEEKWVTRRIISLALISIPFLILLVVFVGVYRRGGSFSFVSFGNILHEFFDSQGISINVLGHVYEHKDDFPQPGFLYMFDSLYTFITTNPVSRLLFGTHRYGLNTVERAIYGTSLEQTISYIVAPTTYLNGSGMGTSYVAEVYLAGGYIGLFAFNLIFSIVLDKIRRYNYSKLVPSTLCLIFIESMFIIPRNSVDSFVGEFLSVLHLGAIVAMYVMYYLVKRNHG